MQQDSSAGLSQLETSTFSQAKLYLTGVKDIETDIIETHYGGWGMGSKYEMNWMFLVPYGKAECLLSFGSLADYERVKALDYHLSRRIRDSQILRLWGVTQMVYNWKHLPKVVNDGLILAGAATNWAGIDSAIITGRFAGEVAAEAVEEGDFSEKKLHKYEELSTQKISYLRGEYMFKFHRRTDEEIEEMWDEEVVQQKEFACNDILPI